MIRVDRVPEPPTFEAEVRQPGNAWLAAHPDASPDEKPLWRTHLKPLAEGFRELCGYNAMWTQAGTVDHYRSKASSVGRALAYEWTNYRFASGRMNQRKGSWDTRILDPFAIEDGWFEIQLPSLQLVMIEERIPRIHHDDARFTLKTLGLGGEDAVIEIRASWYNRFIEGKLPLAALADFAPLIARAVKQRLDTIPLDAFEDERTPFQRFLDSDLTLKGLRNEAPRIAAAVDATLPPASFEPET